MVDLVLEHTRQQAVALQLNGRARRIPGFHKDAHRAGDLLNEPGKEETTLLAALGALRLADSWIDEDNLPSRITAGGWIDHRYLFHDADLGRGQADPFVRIHGFEQVRHKPAQIARFRFSDRIAGRLEAPVGEENDFSDH